MIEPDWQKMLAEVEEQPEQEPIDDHADIRRLDQNMVQRLRCASKAEQRRFIEDSWQRAVDLSLPFDERLTAWRTAQTLETHLKVKVLPADPADEPKKPKTEGRLHRSVFHGPRVKREPESFL